VTTSPNWWEQVRDLLDKLKALLHTMNSRLEVKVERACQEMWLEAQMQNLSVTRVL